MLGIDSVKVLIWQLYLYNDFSIIILYHWYVNMYCIYYRDGTTIVYVIAFFILALLGSFLTTLGLRAQVGTQRFHSTRYFLRYYLETVTLFN